MAVVAADSKGSKILDKQTRSAILRLSSEGYGTRRIALLLCVSPVTVRKIIFFPQGESLAGNTAAAGLFAQHVSRLEFFLRKRIAQLLQGVAKCAQVFGCYDQIFSTGVTAECAGVSVPGNCGGSRFIAHFDQ